MLLREGSLRIRITKLDPWRVMAIVGLGSHDAPSPMPLSNHKKERTGPSMVQPGSNNRRNGHWILQEMHTHTKHDVNVEQIPI